MYYLSLMISKLSETVKVFTYMSNVQITRFGLLLAKEQQTTITGFTVKQNIQPLLRIYIIYIIFTSKL